MLNSFLNIGVVTNSSDDLASYESCLNLDDLKECKKKIPRKKKLDLDSVTMNFNCKWSECSYESSTKRDYFLHVSTHVDNLWTEEWQCDDESMYTLVSFTFYFFLNTIWFNFFMFFRMVFVFVEQLYI